MLFLLLQVYVFAQSRTIKGTVKDSKTSETLPGVTVLVEGTTIATSTNMDGQFSINVEGEDKKLVFSSVGYKTITIPANKEVIDISFEPDAKLLKETVVTALGVSKEKKALGYSISEVSGDELRKSGESNVIEALAAKAPGINVVGSSGTPGASAKILIRGTARFIGSSQPLIVIDGVPVDNETNGAKAGDNPFNANLGGVSESNRALDINADDIESVSILKGPAAAALYGARAGAGAVIYTTKRGRFGKGNGLGVTFNSSVEISKVNKLPALQMVYGQGAGGVFTNATPNSWGPKVADMGLVARNPYDDFFKTGYAYTNNIGITGGNETNSFRLGVGNVKQTGTVPNTGMDRTSVRLTADSKISDKITVGGTANYTNTQASRAQNGSTVAGVMLALARTPVNFDMRDYLNADGTQKQYFSGYDNPLFTAYKNPYTDQTNRFLGNGYVNYKPSKAFDLSWKLGADEYSTNTQQAFAIYSKGDNGNRGVGQVNLTNTSHRNVYTDLLLRYNTQLSENIGFNALAGYNFVYNEDSYNYARGQNLIAPYIYNLNNASELYASNNRSLYRTKALLVDASFDFKKMVYLTLTARDEWNTAFGKDAKGNVYPKADISWVFSETFKLPTWFSFGKVRLAASNVGIAPQVYSDRTYYIKPIFTDGFTNGNTFPYLGGGGLAISSLLGNANLKPERVKGLEAGLDVRFFNGRLTFDFTAYQQTSIDLLMQIPVPSTSGYQARQLNSGELVNKGLELAIGMDPIHTENFNWNMTVGWSKNVSKVTKLVNDVKEFSIESAFTGIGYYAILNQPLGVFYGTKWKRNTNGDYLLNEDGLPQIDGKSTAIGNPNPDWLMNINNTFTYKAWSFSFLWDIRKGGDIWNGTKGALNLRGKSLASADRDQTFDIKGVYDEGTPNAGQATTGHMTGTYYFQNFVSSNGAAEAIIEDGSWIRLRSISLSYRFNLTKGDKIYKVKYVELGASTRNVLLFTKYTGVDPETSLTGAGSNLNGFDFFNNPSTKSLIFNIKLGF